MLIAKKEPDLFPIQQFNFWQKNETELFSLSGSATFNFEGC